MYSAYWYSVLKMTDTHANSDYQCSCLHLLYQPQVLVESARKVTGGAGAGVFEQGAGALDVVAAFHLLSSYTPRASLLPPTLNLTDPYMWPYSRQVSDEL